MTAEWLTALSTTVYVVATIVICIANFKSSKATREQTREQQRQFEELNRPCIDVYYDVIRNGLATLHIENTGKRLAKDVIITINESFLFQITDKRVQAALKTLPGNSFNLGVNQSWYLNLGAAFSIRESTSEPIVVSVSYSDGYRTYSASFKIDLAAFDSILLYDSVLGEISKHQKKMSENSEKQIKALSEIQRTMKEGK